MGVPAFEPVRVLRGELTSRAGRHADASGTLNWPPDMCRSVAALFTIWSSASKLKLHVITSTIGPAAIALK
jgi:hypothetical protein